MTGVKKMISRGVKDMSDFEKNSVVASEDEDPSKKKKKSSTHDKDSKNRVGNGFKIILLTL
jgi:hypothetical protein